MRAVCPSCHETLNLVAEIASVVVEDVRPAQKMGGWDPAPVEPTIGELGLCGDGHVKNEACNNEHGCQCSGDGPCYGCR